MIHACAITPLTDTLVSRDRARELALDDLTLLDQVLAEATGLVEDHCRRKLRAATVVQVWRQWGEIDQPLPQVLDLDHSPVAAVTSVRLDDLTLLDQAGVDAALVADPLSLAEVGFEVSSSIGGANLTRIDAGQPAPWVGQRLTATYSAGFQPDGASLGGAPFEVTPPSLVRAILQVAAGIAASRGADPRLRSESIEGVGQRLYLDPGKGGGLIPEQVLTALERYQRPWIG